MFENLAEFGDDLGLVADWVVGNIVAFTILPVAGVSLVLLFVNFRLHNIVPSKIQACKAPILLKNR